MINLKLSWQYFDITGQTSAPQPALILSSDSIGLGSTFELQCKVYIDRGGSVFMTWTYTSNEVGSNVPRYCLNFLGNTGCQTNFTIFTVYTIFPSNTIKCSTSECISCDQLISVQSLPEFFSPTCPKGKFGKKKNIYSNKFFHDFHLAESSFTCPRLRISGLAWRLSVIVNIYMYCLNLSTFYQSICTH